ncbi:MAG: CHAP domain-containing protein [Propionibacteriaceae bacterium]
MANDLGRIRQATAATLCALALTLGVGTSSVAYADTPTPTPTVSNAPTSAADAKTQVETLQKQVDELDRQYAQIQDRVSVTVQKVDARNAEIKATETSIVETRKKLGRAALTQYQTRGTTPIAQMVLAPDSDKVLASLSMVDKIAADQTTLMQRYQADQANLAEVKRQCEKDLASAQADKDKLDALDNEAKQRLEEMKKLFVQLSDKEKEELLQAQRSAAAAATATSTTSSTTRTTAAAPSVVAARSTGTSGVFDAAAFQSSGGQKSIEDFPKATSYSSPSVAVVFNSANNYAWGNCTWYAAARRAGLGKPIGASWGNANMWPGSAAAQGYTTGRTPAVGAMYIEYPGIYGHVMIVEYVNPDGSFVISEMNNLYYGGLGIINFRFMRSVQGTFIY